MGDYRRKLLTQVSWGPIFAFVHPLKTFRYPKGRAGWEVPKDPNVLAGMHQAQLELIAAGLTDVLHRLARGGFAPREIEFVPGM